MNDQVVSIIGSSYFQPIADLIEKLIQHDDGREADIMAGHYQNGYATSVCLLSVVLLESYVMRCRYIHKASEEELKTPVIKFIKSKYSDYPYEEETVEVFVVRDLIAHNHLLETAYTLTDKGMKKNGVIRFSSGDGKFKVSVDLRKEKTKVLQLNTVPTKIGLRDVEKILGTVWENLIYLESKDRDQCYVSHLTVRYRGERIKFSEVVHSLHRNLSDI
ncbi:MAG: hypothetical protein MK096_15115 [Oleiphilaceae bacterium]|nr:hypothetical protein [Oleiphilaceae bacterium]